MQQPIAQQLQRTQQLCTNAMNLCQQVVQELGQISQSVQTSTYSQPGYAQQGYGQGNQGSQGSYQPSTYGYGQSSMSTAQSPGLQSVMQADRAYSMQENTPSNRNYNTAATTQFSPQSTSGGSYGVQSVMSADRMAPQSYGGSNSAGGSSGGYAGSYSGGVGTVMQADRFSSNY